MDMFYQCVFHDYISYIFWSESVHSAYKQLLIHMDVMAGVMYVTFYSADRALTRYQAWRSLHRCSAQYIGKKKEMFARSVLIHCHLPNLPTEELAQQCVCSLQVHEVEKNGLWTSSHVLAIRNLGRMWVWEVWPSRYSPVLNVYPLLMVNQQYYCES